MKRKNNERILILAKQSVERTKTLLASSVTSSMAPGRLDRRSATITRAEFEQQASVSQVQDESGGLRASSRKRTFSQSSEEPDPDLEQGEIRSREDSPAYSDMLETIKKWLDLEVKDVECFVPPSVFSGSSAYGRNRRYKEFSALGSNNVDDNDPHQ